MSGKPFSYLLALLIGGGLVLILWSSLSQPGVNDLPGNFKEVALYRNENNTGPVHRIYAVTVADTLWQEMQQYGEYMPYTKYGTTTVYFFKEGQPVPTQVQPGSQPFAAAYQPHVLAVYEKESMGQVRFTRYPYAD